MNAIIVSPTPLVDDSWGRQNRLALQRSRCSELLENGESDAEVRAAMPPAVVEMVEAALTMAIAEMQPAREEDLVARVTRHAGIIGQDWSPGGKAEFIAMIVSELSDFPAEIVLDALDRARRKVTVGRILLVWVCDDVAPRVAKLQVEYQRLLRLVEIAATPA